MQDDPSSWLSFCLVDCVWETGLRKATSTEFFKFSQGETAVASGLFSFSLTGMCRTKLSQNIVICAGTLIRGHLAVIHFALVKYRVILHTYWTQLFLMYHIAISCCRDPNFPQESFTVSLCGSGYIDCSILINH